MGSASALPSRQAAARSRLIEARSRATATWQPLAHAQDRRKGPAYEGDGASGATAGFRRVSDLFVATSTRQLAAVEDKIHIFSNPIPIYSSSNPPFPAQQLAAP
jgi:hypothetical protein